MARSKLQHLVVDDDGNVIPLASVQVLASDGSAYSGTLYSAPSGGGTVTSPVTASAEGLLEVYTDKSTTARALLRRTGAVDLKTEFMFDPAEILFQGMTATAAFGGAVTVATDLTVSDDLNVTDDGEFGGDLYAGRLGVYAGGSGALVIPSDNLVLIGETITENPPLGQTVAIETNVMNGAGGDYSAIRSVLRDYANNQMHAIESHLVSNTVAANNAVLRSALTLTTNVRTAGATGVENSALRIISGVFPIPGGASPAASDVGILMNHGGGSEFTEFFRCYAVDGTVRFKVKTDGEMTTGTHIPRGANSYDIGSFAAPFRWMITNLLFAATGDAANPSIAFKDDGDNGLFLATTNTVGGSAGGTEVWRMTSTKFTLAKMLSLSQGEFLTGIISPAQLTANTNDWQPTGLATCRVIRVSTDASRDLTGLAAPVGSTDGMVVTIRNVGTQNLVLKHQVTSAATNQFKLPGGTDITLGADAAITLWYDPTTARWTRMDT